MRCIECGRFSFRDVKPDIAKSGFGLCADDKPWIYSPARKEWVCEKFIPANQKAVAERVEWIENIVKSKRLDSYR